jgi:hypothetical protein
MVTRFLRSCEAINSTESSCVKKILYNKKLGAGIGNAAEIPQKMPC